MLDLLPLFLLLSNLFILLGLLSVSLPFSRIGRLFRICHWSYLTLVALFLGRSFGSLASNQIARASRSPFRFVLLKIQWTPPLNISQHLLFGYSQKWSRKLHFGWLSFRVFNANVKKLGSGSRYCRYGRYL